jgi:hypothetical protein
MTSKSSSSGLASSLMTCLWKGRIGLCFLLLAEPEPEGFLTRRGFSLNSTEGAGDAMTDELEREGYAFGRRGGLDINFSDSSSSLWAEAESYGAFYRLRLGAAKRRFSFTSSSVVR